MLVAFENLSATSQIVRYQSASAVLKGFECCLAGSLRVSSTTLLQGSSDFGSTSVLTGLQPFLAANAALMAGSTTSKANCSCAFAFFGFLVLRNPQASTVTTTPLVPGIFMQSKSTPGCLPAARNSPFIQSPWICRSALPVMTRLVVSFHFRFGEPGSVCCWNFRNAASAC